MSRFLVTSSPHISSPVTTRGIMLDVILALMPVSIASGILFGMRAYLILLFSAASCVLLEELWNRFAKKPRSTDDLSAVVTGLLIALNLPVSVPLWQVFFGCCVAILIVKQLFGGLGRNFVNPALAARVVMALSFPQDMTAYSYPLSVPDALTGATPLARLGELDWESFPELLLGNHGGVIGETCALALIAGGIYLIARKVIRPTIPVSFLLSVWVFSAVFGCEAPFLSLFAGGVMLGSIFMATDYVTSPYTPNGQLIYGILCGLITALIRCYASSAEGFSFAILLMNLLVPYINNFTRRKPFGGGAA